MADRDLIGLVEDSDLDFEMVQLGARLHRPAVTLIRVNNLHGANQLLEATGLRGLIIDLNLPDGYGLDLVREVKGDPRLADSLRVVVFSTSANPYDRERALDLGADAVFEKPSIPEHFIETSLSVIDAALGRESSDACLVGAGA